MNDPRLDEFRSCAEALIDASIIPAESDRDLHQRIRRHQRALNAWFSEQVGWRLVEHPEFVRLIKPVEYPEPAYAMSWAADRRDYELFVWLLWFAEQTAGRKFTISQVADAIRERSAEAGEDGAFDWLTISERRRLVRVMGAMQDMRVIRIRDGSLREWQEETGKRDALCEWGAATWNLNVPFLTEELQRLAEGELSRIPAVDRVRPNPRMRLYRQLLLGPALFRREDPEAFDILQDEEERRYIAEDLRLHIGWILEVTTSYARLLRPANRADSVRPPIPTEGSESHVIILLCGVFRKLQQEGALMAIGDDHFLISAAQLELAIADLQERFGGNWKQELRTSSANDVFRRILPDMLAWGLLRPGETSDQWIVTPLAARLDGIYIGPRKLDDQLAREDDGNAIEFA